MKGVSVIIPSWNGLHLLKKNLPSVIEDCKRSGFSYEIIIIDDGSTDKTYEKLPQLFPEVKILRNEVNRGFVSSINSGINSAKYPYLLLLNNDISISPGTISGLMRDVGDDIFAVQMKLAGSNIGEGGIIGKFKYRFGFLFYHYKEFSGDETEVDFVSAGCSLFSREKLLMLGLFDEIYTPGYFEDIDLCFKAKLFGWKMLYRSKAMGYHIHPGQSFRKKFSISSLKRLHKRNFAIFHLKNMPATKFFYIQPFLLFGYVFLKSFFDPYYIVGFFEAIIRLFKKKPPQAKKNILFIDSPISPPGGGQISLQLIMKHLSKNQKYQPYLLSNKKIPNLFKKLKIPAIVMNFSITNFISNLVKMLYIINLIKPKAIHCNSPTTFTTFVAAIAAKISGVPFLWHVRTIGKAGWKDKLIASLTKKIIVISDAVGAKFHQRKKIIKIYNSIDTDEFKSIKVNRNKFGLPDGKIIGNFSRLVPWKGHKLFIESGLEVIKRLPDVTFIIVGSGDRKYETKLKSYLEKLGVKKKFIFFGYRTDIPELMNVCDVIVNSSIEPEPFGRVIIEAMGCSKPVISTSLGGVREIIENWVDGVVVKPDKVELSEALLKLLTDNRLSLMIGKNARRKVKKMFDIKLQIKYLEDIYKNA